MSIRWEFVIIWLNVNDQVGAVCRLSKMVLTRRRFYALLSKADCELNGFGMLICFGHSGCKKHFHRFILASPWLVSCSMDAITAPFCPLRPVVSTFTVT